MRQVIITVIRDILNLALCFSMLISITIYIYKLNPELEPLKYTLFPFEAAILVCILASIGFIFVNRLTTFVAIRLLRRMGNV